MIGNETVIIRRIPEVVLDAIGPVHLGDRQSASIRLEHHLAQGTFDLSLLMTLLLSRFSDIICFLPILTTMIFKLNLSERLIGRCSSTSTASIRFGSPSLVSTSPST